MSQTIKEIKSKEIGEQVSVKVILSKKETKYTKAKKPYLFIGISDKTGTLEFPIWDQFQLRNEKLIVDNKYVISGFLTAYNGAMQIKDPMFSAVPNDDNEVMVDNYDITEELLEEFMSIVHSLKDPYKTFVARAIGAREICDVETDADNKLLEKRWENFTHCPASAGHHQAKVGGLFIHTLGVVKNLIAMMKSYETGPIKTLGIINRDRLIAKGILHDNKKDFEYAWDKCIKHKGVKGHHLTLGYAYVYQINEELGNIFDEKEIENIAYGILSHHEHFGTHMPETPEDVLLHCADMIDTQMADLAEGHKE
jgi:3'-5' exoribonuclease